MEFNSLAVEGLVIYDLNVQVAALYPISDVWRGTQQYGA